MNEQALRAQIKRVVAAAECDAPELGDLLGQLDAMMTADGIDRSTAVRLIGQIGPIVFEAWYVAHRLGNLDDEPIRRGLILERCVEQPLGGPCAQDWIPLM